MQALQECLHQCPILSGDKREETDPIRFTCLLRSRRERPRGCRAAEQRDEVATFHGAYPKAGITD
jgi:hypothetical protein